MFSKRRYRLFVLVVIGLSLNQVLFPGIGEAMYRCLGPVRRVSESPLNLKWTEARSIEGDTTWFDSKRLTTQRGFGLERNADAFVSLDAVLMVQRVASGDFDSIAHLYVPKAESPVSEQEGADKIGTLEDLAGLHFKMFERVQGFFSNHGSGDYYVITSREVLGASGFQLVAYVLGGDGPTEHFSSGVIEGKPGSVKIGFSPASNAFVVETRSRDFFLGGRNIAEPYFPK